MLDELAKIQDEVRQALQNAADLRSLEEVRNTYLGRKGRVAALFEALPKVSVEDRRVIGPKLNALKKELTDLLEKHLQEKQRQALTRQLEHEKFDISLPGVGSQGSLHPITLVIDEIIRIYERLGFSAVDGREIETEFYNFDALNIPKDHPARDMHDTFYLEMGTLLRTHTSPAQVHIMQKRELPLAIVVPGKVYRCDADISHSPMFHQVEGLLVNQTASFGELKGAIVYFLEEFFGGTRPVRFRPSFFPFTEPSAEVDIQCVLCGGKGCRVCKGSGWLEVMGCGMVHPNVFKAVKVDSTKYRGYAFGMGVERLAMLRYHMDDIRVFFENDVRFLRQFA